MSNEQENSAVSEAPVAAEGEGTVATAASQSQPQAQSSGDRRGGDRRGGRDRRNGDRRGGGRRDRRDGPRADLQANEYSDKVVHVNRCAKVVKGGRRFSFAALVVSGDGKGRVGLGYGKAKEVPDAIRKGTDRAHHSFKTVQLRGNTIPHEVFGEHDGGRVLLRPAASGTGIIAGGGVRAVLEVVGVKDVLSKSLGSNNPLAIVKATIDGLLKLRTLEQIRGIRGIQPAVPAGEVVADEVGASPETTAVTADTL